MVFKYLPKTRKAYFRTSHEDDQQYDFISKKHPLTGDPAVLDITKILKDANEELIKPLSLRFYGKGLNTPGSGAQFMAGVSLHRGQDEQFPFHFVAPVNLLYWLHRVLCGHLGSARIEDFFAIDSDAGDTAIDALDAFYGQVYPTKTSSRIFGVRSFLKAVASQSNVKGKSSTSVRYSGISRYPAFLGVQIKGGDVTLDNGNLCEKILQAREYVQGSLDTEWVPRIVFACVALIEAIHVIQSTVVEVDGAKKTWRQVCDADQSASGRIISSIINFFGLWGTMFCGKNDASATEFRSMRTFDLMKVLHDDDALTNVFIAYVEDRNITSLMKACKSYFTVTKEWKGGNDKVASLSKVPYDELVDFVMLGWIASDSSFSVKVASLLAFREAMIKQRVIGMLPEKMIPADCGKRYSSLAEACQIKGEGSNASADEDGCAIHMMLLGAKIRNEKNQPIDPFFQQPFESASKSEITLSPTDTVSTYNAMLSSYKNAILLWNEFVDSYFTTKAPPAYAVVRTRKADYLHSHVYYHFSFFSPMSFTNQGLTVRNRLGLKTTFKSDGIEVQPEQMYKSDVAQVERAFTFDLSTEADSSRDDGRRRSLPTTYCHTAQLKTKKTKIDLSFYGRCLLSIDDIERWQETFYRCDPVTAGGDGRKIRFEAKAEGYLLKPGCGSVSGDRIDILMDGKIYEDTSALDVTGSKYSNVFIEYDPLKLSLMVRVVEYGYGEPQLLNSLYRRKLDQLLSATHVAQKYAEEKPGIILRKRLRVPYGNPSDFFDPAEHEVIHRLITFSTLPSQYTMEDIKYEKAFKPRRTLSRWAKIKFAVDRDSLPSAYFVDHKDGDPYYPPKGREKDTIKVQVKEGGAFKAKEVHRLTVYDTPYSDNKQLLNAEMWVDLVSDVTWGDGVRGRYNTDEMCIDFKGLFPGLIIPSENSLMYQVFKPNVGLQFDGLTLADVLTNLHFTHDIGADICSVLPPFHAASLALSKNMQAPADAVERVAKSCHDFAYYLKDMLLLYFNVASLKQIGDDWHEAGGCTLISWEQVGNALDEMDQIYEKAAKLKFNLDEAEVRKMFASLAEKLKGLLYGPRDALPTDYELVLTPYSRFFNYNWQWVWFAYYHNITTFSVNSFELVQAVNILPVLSKVTNDERSDTTWTADIPFVQEQIQRCVRILVDQMADSILRGK